MSTLGLKKFLLVDSTGALVGHADELGTAQTLADDVALGVDREVTVYTKVSQHVPRAFTEVERAEKTGEGGLVVDAKVARSEAVVKAAAKEVAAALKPPKKDAEF